MTQGMVGPGNQWQEVANPVNPENMGVPVFGPTEVRASLAPWIKRDLTTTMQTISFVGGRWAQLSYRLLPGATAVTNQFAKAVINAASDADATGKLATDGAFIALCQGDDVMISAPQSDPITRIDIIAEQAVGAEKTIFTVLAGV